MPKAERRRRGRQPPPPPKDEGGDKKKGSRLRREERRARFLDKLHQNERERVKAVEAAKPKKKGATLSNFGSLAEALEHYGASVPSKSPAKEPRKSSTGRVSNKARKKMLAQEVSLFKAVMSHPAMKENPYAAIAEHLRNTVVAEAQQAAAAPAAEKA